MMYLFEKSLSYTLLPKLSDVLTGVGGQSIVLVVSPPRVLMKDKVGTVMKMGTRATYVSDKVRMHTTAMRQETESGEYQRAFVSSEALLFKMEWRRILSSSVYRLTELVCSG